VCPEMVESKWKHYSSSDDAFIDSQDTAKARCSDCTKNPTDPECLTCCDSVNVVAGASTSLSSQFTGTFTANTELTTSAGSTAKVYKRGTGDNSNSICLWMVAASKNWAIGGCASAGQNSAYTFQDSSALSTAEKLFAASCPANGLQWQYVGSGETVVMNAVCSESCGSNPPSAPSGGSSNWDGSSKAGGTIISYTCPDTSNNMKAVCDAATLTWKPETIPAC